MQSFFILIAFASGILFIILDLGWYFIRKKYKIDGYTQKYADRIYLKLDIIRSRLPFARIGAFVRTINGKLITYFLPQKPPAITEELRAGSITASSPPDRIITINYHQKKSPGRLEAGKVGSSVKVDISADMPEGTSLQIDLQVDHGMVSLKAATTSSNSQPIVTNLTTSDLFQERLRQYFRHPDLRFIQVENLDKILLIAAILVYAFVIGFHIDRYPIYFFTDEAAHMNFAANFIRDGFENYFGEFLPTFFINEGWVNGTSVYLQVIPFLLFGKSVVVTRLVSAFISLLGALCAGLLVRDTLKLKYYWAGIFAVLTTPAWFLHARTAFEYVEVASFYSIFLYFYSRYRAGHLRSLYWAIIAAALAFYTHGLGQILITVSGVALFIIDFRYHFHPDRRKTIIKATFLVLLVLLPFARYYFAHPGEVSGQIKRRGSYWVDANLTVLQKIWEFLSQYLFGLNPFYWFIKNKVDLNRHTMDGYGNGLFFTFPFFLLGLYKAVKNIRLPSYQIILLSFLICPIPASVVAIGMPRMLWMTFPVALLSVLGLSEILQWIESRWYLKPVSISIAVFILLASISFYMLRDALVNGPTWFQDYSLYGMQYGAKQVFQDVVCVGLEQEPNRHYVVSPSWANGTEQFIDFFIPVQDRSRVSLGQPINFIPDIRKNPDSMYFIATFAEYDKLINDPEFQDIKVEQILPYPNHTPGFYVLTLHAADNIEELLAAEHLKNVTPLEDSIALNGQIIKIMHSPLGSGRLEDIFDQNPDTLARVLEANPFIFDLYPAIPLDTNSITVQTGSLAKFTITVTLYAPNSNQAITYTHTFENLPPDPSVNMKFENGPAKSSRIYIEIKDELSGTTSQIHVRTIEFK